MIMPSKSGEKTPSVAAQATAKLVEKFREQQTEIAELRERIEKLEATVVEPKPEPTDLTHTPTIVINVIKNKVEEAYANVPGLVILVRDGDIISDPSLVESADLNQTGVVGVTALPFYDM